MKSTDSSYDVFIAYASPDAAYAKQLFGILHSIDLAVFLDSEIIQPGDPWLHEIRNAQRRSLLTVVLISSASEESYFQREEVLAAIELSQQDQRHRVVPVYLKGNKPPDVVPHPLRQLHGVFLEENYSILDVAQKIEAALRLYRDRKDFASTTAVEPTPVASSSAQLRDHVRAVRVAARRTDAVISLRNFYGLAKDTVVSTLVYVDIDDFTVINRRFGELVGDEIVRFLESLFSSSKSVRWGADEFIICLPELDIEDATNLAEQWREQIESHSWEGIAPSLRVSASFGVAELLDEEPMEHWLVRAFHGADNAKRSGKNKVGMAPITLPSDMPTDVYASGSPPWK